MDPDLWLDMLELEAAGYIERVGEDGWELTDAGYALLVEASRNPPLSWELRAVDEILDDEESGND